MKTAKTKIIQLFDLMMEEQQTPVSVSKEEASTSEEFETWAKRVTQHSAGYLKWAKSDWSLKIHNLPVPPAIFGGLPFGTTTPSFPNPSLQRFT